MAGWIAPIAGELYTGRVHFRLAYLAGSLKLMEAYGVAARASGLSIP